MVLGNVVRIVVGFYGGLQIIFGSILLASPIFIQNIFPNAEINLPHIIVISLFMIGIGFFFLIGVFKLREI